MKKFALALFFALLAGNFLIYAPLQAQDPTGRWEGTLSFSGNQIPLVFTIENKPAGLKATLDSPDQHAFGIAVDSIEFQDDSLFLLLPRLGATYRGRLGQSSQTLTGHWQQGGLSLPLTFRKVSEDADSLPPQKAADVVAKPRPQEPAEPFPYHSEEVRFENKAAGITLAGTFTRPKVDGQYPAVVLVTGSGPQDRNETILGHKPFLLLSDYLARQGIAVLRYDDRGFGESGGKFIQATTTDFAGDAAAAVQYLQYRPDVRANQIGMLGHSEGGIIAPLVALAGEPLAYIVLLAGPAVPGHELMIAQIGSIIEATGAPKEIVEQRKLQQGEVLSVVLHQQDSLEAAKQLEDLLRLSREEMTAGSEAAGAPSDTHIKAQVAQLLDPWFRNFIAYNPQPALKELSVPTLALFGGKDVQVPARLNQAALESLENEHIEVKVFPGMNHLFQPASSGLPHEYGQIETTMAPEVLETISSWIWEQLRQPTE